MCSGLAAEAVRERRAERLQPLGRPVPPRGVRLRREHVVHRALKRLGRKAVERGDAGGDRDQVRVGRRPHEIAHGRLVRLERGRGDLAAPGKRRAGGVRLRGHERAAADVAADQPARLELAVGADHRRAADLQRRRQIALGRQLQAGGHGAARDPAFEQRHEPAIQRARARQRLRVDAEGAKQTIHRLACLTDDGLGHDVFTMPPETSPIKAPAAPSRARPTASST